MELREKGPERSRKPPEVTQQVSSRAGSRTPLLRGPGRPWVCVDATDSLRRQGPSQEAGPLGSGMLGFKPWLCHVLAV